MTRNRYIWILNGISLMLTCGALEGALLRNVALNQTAVQSSSTPAGPAEKAVDGNRNPRFVDGSCTLTNEESDPWWRVDLQDVYKVAAVTVTNTDEHENRLDGAEVWIETSVGTSRAKDFRCAVISHIPKGQTVYISCSGKEGRYVTVLLPGAKRILSLCEVEVYPLEHENHLPNLALRGEAVQSSTHHFGVASNAIDGNRDSYYYNWSCSHTARASASWWRLDLHKTYLIASVKITNRGDCCAQRLDGAEIRIGNSLENNGTLNPRCASITHVRLGETKTFYCERGSMRGRFVNVVITGNRGSLSLCEVEVYAALPEPAEELLANVALNGKAMQSTAYDHYSYASNAINGDTTGMVHSNTKITQCCTHTLQQASPWWRVDLLAAYRISAVTIFNRQDCCLSRLMGAEILIGNSLLYNGTRNPRCGAISSVKSSYTFYCGDMEGRYVVVSLPGDKKILSLGEVEVYAYLAEPEITPTSPSPPPTKSMLLNGRNVTVVQKRLCWSDALLYCRHHHWDLLSLHSQEEQDEVEQLLSCCPFPLTDYVWMGLRRNIMGNTWFWMSGKSMGFTKWLHDLAPDRLSHACGGMPRREPFLWENQPCDNLLNFVCQSDGEEGAHKVYFYSSREHRIP